MWTGVRFSAPPPNFVMVFMTIGFEELLSSIITLPTAIGSGAVFVGALLLLILLKKVVFKVLLIILVVVSFCVVLLYVIITFLFGDSLWMQFPTSLATIPICLSCGFLVR